ncbi:hypothetical protein DMENIID0001_122270 [Sergentomyia squamirostris]
MIWIVLVVALVALGYFHFERKQTEKREFFVSKGIKVNKPSYFIVTMYKIITGQMSVIQMVQGIYNEHSSSEKVIGLWDGETPVIMLKDPEVIKHFVVKEFEHFQDRKEFLSEEMDPLFGNSLFSLREQKWRDMRATLSPAFTGSKMRQMCDFIVEIGEQMVNYLNKENKEKGPQVLEMSEFFTRVSSDVIATCAFGINVDSLTHRNNEVYEAAKKLSDFSSPIKMIKFIIYRFFPKLLIWLGIKTVDEKEANFLRKLVVEAMKIREEQNIIRPDMIHLLMEAQKGTLTHAEVDKDTAGFATVEQSNVGWKKTNRVWTETDIVAQCFVFLLAGFETTASTLGFASYAIGVNPEIQKRLYEEVKEVNDGLNGKRLTYDTLNKMKYLDMVISETLRRYPPIAIIDRECNKNITLNLYENFPWDFKKTHVCWIPIYALHLDPKHYPDPEKFDPERFSEENKSSINPGAYLPFGIGPRNCVGSRFALMELKALIYFMVLNFSLEVTEKTQIPLKLANSFGALSSEKGIYFKLRPRE